MNREVVQDLLKHQLAEIMGGWAAITRSQNTAVVQAEIMGGARTRALPKACALLKLRWPYRCGNWALPMPRGRTDRLGAARRIDRGN